MFEKLELKKKMDNSYLIQRLQKPSGPELDNLFSFGGGLKNGGLSDSAMKLLRAIFSFDYMGSAEFEFGAVPSAFNFIAEQAGKDNLVEGRIINNKNNGKEYIYYICPKQYEEDVKERINKLRKSESDFRLKEFCGLKDYFESKSDYSKRNQGWIELDNGFMFFVNEEMFQKTKKLFGIKKE